MRDSCKVYDEVMIKHSFFFLSTYFAHKKDEPKVRKKRWHEDNVHFAESDNNIWMTFKSFAYHMSSPQNTTNILFQRLYVLAKAAI